jgi:hypothetical protein
MSENKPVTHAGPVDMLATWEGPAIPAPGILNDDREAKQLAVDGDTVALAAWVGVTVLSGGVGHSAHDAIKRKVLDVLAAWRRRWGQEKIEAVKQQLLLQMQQRRKNPKTTDAELRERIERLFHEIES